VEKKPTGWEREARNDSGGTIGAREDAGEGKEEEKEKEKTEEEEMEEGEREKEDERSYFPGEIKVNRVLYLLVFHLFHCFTIVQLSRKLLYLNLLLGIIWNFSDVSVLMRRGI